MELYQWSFEEEMGSEHYCLRWNNHQSNLLGVFSQLLRDESLVDVTLACSEGHSIRAHKVVLSACSSYFQTLFLDHPSRHPIVILKDVRFAELRTLIEFMYKGEVNVEYCQLSALLKTAESLKVKGLAEMTRDCKPEYNKHYHHHQQLHHHQQQQQQQHRLISSHNLQNKEDVDHSERDDDEEEIGVLEERDGEQMEPTELVTRKQTVQVVGEILAAENVNCGRLTPVTIPPPLTATATAMAVDQPSSIDKDSSNVVVSEEFENESVCSDTEMPNDMTTTATATTVHHHHHHQHNNTCVTSSHLLPPPPCAGRLSPPSSSSSSQQQQSSSMSLIQPHQDSIPGTSSLPPVQQVPLSLKKEVDWGGGGGGDEKNTKDPPDFCRSQESDYLQDSCASSQIKREEGCSPVRLQPQFPCMYCGTSFPHQSKLTRHILSHSLETLKYRELQQQHQLAMPPPPPTAQDIQIQPSRVAMMTSSSSASHEPPDPCNLPPPPPPSSIEQQQQLMMDTDVAQSAESMSSGGGGVGGGGGCANSGVVLCKFCGKSFPDVGSLIGHLPVHTGDRPFKCEFCGKAFKLRHHMKDHCRVHTGERPFRCSLCGKTFSRSTILKAHEKTHYPKYVRKFLSPSPLDSAEEETPH